MSVLFVVVTLALAVKPVLGYISNGTVIIPAASSYNGLNLVPQMGWDNWNSYACSVNESLLLSTARSMVNYGLRDLGYNYVILDDCWSSGRDQYGILQANTLRFPRGMGPIADDLHAMGMKFGMYSSAGTFTCAKYPGSLGYETQDAEFFASNGVDYLKYDNCFNRGQSGTPKLSFDRYNVMSQALNATGRPIVYSLCNWGDDNPYDWAYDISNSGRMSGDIYDSFNRPDAACPCNENPCNWPGFHCSVMNILNKMAPIFSRTMSGYFNDLDMLEVGNGGQSDSEYVLHFSMWAMMSSPLIMGTDVAGLSPANLAILSNPAVIALNQDTSASAAQRIWRKACDDVDEWGQCELALWARGLANGDTAIALINAANSSTTMTANVSDIFYGNAHAGTSKPISQLSQTWDVYDLWANRMSNAEAASVLNGTASVIGNSTTRYNATLMPYLQGLGANHPALFGGLVGQIMPTPGNWTVTLERHSVGLYRLRPVTSLRKRDEL